MGEKNKKPNIRFKNFTEDWESQKLGDIVSITMGQSPNGNTYTSKKSDYILVQGNADLQNGWVEPRVWTTQKTKTANAGDLILSVRAPAGAIGKTKYDVVIGRGVAAIKGNEFIYQKLYKMNEDDYWAKYSCGSTFDSINSDSINSAEIMIPSEEEQNQIGLFFKNIDKVIEECQNEFKSLQNIKKSLLQKMFPDNNDDKPKIRFKGFTDAWEQRKLIECVNYITSCLSISDARKNGKYKLYDANGQIGYSPKQHINQDYITIIKDGSGVGRVRLLPKNTYFICTMGGLVANCCDINYIYGLLQNFNFSAHINGATIPHVYFSEYGLTSVKICDTKEQQKIGKVFYSLDSLITLHQRKYEKLQNIKKSLLERMFI